MSRRGIVFVVVLVALQVTAIVIWRVVEGARTPDAPFAAERLSGAAPSIRFEHSDGSTSTLADSRGCPVLLHVWASWCGPCRDELPQVLALDLDGLGVIAAAIDDTWPAMSQLTDTRNQRIVRIERSQAKALGVGELPVTFLVDAGGTMVERYDGARAWNSASARAHLDRILDDELHCSDRKPAP